jgi:hypothetical protein
MATLTRTAGPQEGAHSPGNTALAANHFAKIIWCHMEFQYQGIAVVANFTHLYSGRIINERLSDVFNQFTHIQPNPYFIQ